MIEGIRNLDLYIGIAVFIGVFWWMFSLSTKSRAERQLARTPVKIPRQPWDNDRANRGGNR